MSMVDINGNSVPTFWYCLKTYNRNRVVYIAQQYADGHREWYDPNMICTDEDSCRRRCMELNREA